MGGGEEGREKLLRVSGGSPNNPLGGRPGDASASKGLAAVCRIATEQRWRQSLSLAIILTHNISYSDPCQDSSLDVPISPRGL